MSAVDAVIARATSIPNNLFVTGGSGGGVLTAWIVGKTDRFRAAAAQKPVINWTSFVLTVGRRRLHLPVLVRQEAVGKSEGLLAALAAEPRRQREDADAGCGGSEDYRTPVSESEQFYEALQLRGVDKLVKVPGASH